MSNLPVGRIVLGPRTGVPDTRPDLSKMHIVARTRVKCRNCEGLFLVDTRLLHDPRERCSHCGKVRGFDAY